MKNAPSTKKEYKPAEGMKNKGRCIMYAQRIYLC